MRLVRIREAKPLPDYRVQLTLTDGRIVEIREDAARFPEMRVKDGALVWPTGVDLCPDVLIWVPAARRCAFGRSRHGHFLLDVKQERIAHCHPAAVSRYNVRAHLNGIRRT